ncbi:MAG: MotE family protein [Burkholderiales bacterium]
MDEKKAPDLKGTSEARKTLDIKKSANNISTGKQTSAKVQKKKKKISAGALLSIVLVVLIAGACAAVYFDIGGAKQIVSSLLELDTPAVAAEGGANLSAEQAKFDKREKTLDAKEEELHQKELDLKKLEEDLNAKEQDLDKRESAVKDVEEKVSEQQKQYYTSVAQIYEKMDVKKAAKAISGLASPQEMAQVLLYMSSEQAGKVLDQINSAVATEILSEMMK